MRDTHESGGHTDPRLERRVPSTGLSLSVREYGEPAERAGVHHVVLVHGYPDSQGMWRPVVDRLCAGDMHVVTYDVRGAGASDVPAEKSGYRTELLVDDLLAVLDATIPDRAPVHLVGHDWGSVQLWEAVLSERDDPRLKDRIASFTSISGPAIEHLSYLAKHPRGRELRLLRQLGRSWYVFAFQLPLVPELVWRTAARSRPRLAHDAANGVNLYRANILRAGRRPSDRRTDVPVLVVAPRRDPFLTAVTTEDLDHLCSEVSVVRPDTGHWVPRTDPDLLAGLVREHVTAHA